MPLSGPVDIDTIRCRNQAIEQESIISISLGPVGVKIKQLSEQKVFHHWFACDVMAVLIIILCHYCLCCKEKNVSYLPHNICDLFFYPIPSFSSTTTLHPYRKCILCYNYFCGFVLLKAETG